jgi:hypothetical protein
MKANHLAFALLVAASVPLAAQDTTPQPPAPPAPPAQPAPAAAASNVTVEAVLARSLIDRMPQDTGSAFPADVGQLVLWTKVSGAAGTPIRHVWFHGDAEADNVELNVGGSPWRTWSRKNIPADWTGPWHVEVRDAAGAVLKRIDFTIGQ